jgi:photoactive yellow protein
MSTPLSFSAPDAYLLLEKSLPSLLDQADFGIVKFTREGKILHYNPYESNLAGIPSEEALGKNFFTQIAPCTNNFMVAVKYGDRAADLDETMAYVFTYRIKPTKVQLRLLASAGEETAYLLVVKV